MKHGMHMIGIKRAQNGTVESARGEGRRQPTVKPTGMGTLVRRDRPWLGPQKTRPAAGQTVRCAAHSLRFYRPVTAYK